LCAATKSVSTSTLQRRGSGRSPTAGRSSIALPNRCLYPDGFPIVVSGDTGLSAVCDRSWHGLPHICQRSGGLEQRDWVEGVEDVASVEVGFVVVVV
jgi:hypothetical protein